MEYKHRLSRRDLLKATGTFVASSLLQPRGAEAVKSAEVISSRWTLEGNSLVPIDNVQFVAQIVAFSDQTDGIALAGTSDFRKQIDDRLETARGFYESRIRGITISHGVLDGITMSNKTFEDTLSEALTRTQTGKYLVDAEIPPYYYNFDGQGIYRSVIQVFVPNPDFTRQQYMERTTDAGLSAVVGVGSVKYKDWDKNPLPSADAMGIVQYGAFLLRDPQVLPMERDGIIIHELGHGFGMIHTNPPISEKPLDVMHHPIYPGCYVDNMHLAAMNNNKNTDSIGQTSPLL